MAAAARPPRSSRRHTSPRPPPPGRRSRSRAHRSLRSRTVRATSPAPRFSTGCTRRARLQSRCSRNSPSASARTSLPPATSAGRRPRHSRPQDGVWDGQRLHARVLLPGLHQRGRPVRQQRRRQLLASIRRRAVREPRPRPRGVPPAEHPQHRHDRRHARRDQPRPGRSGGLRERPGAVPGRRAEPVHDVRRGYRRLRRLRPRGGHRDGDPARSGVLLAVARPGDRPGPHELRRRHEHEP